MVANAQLIDPLADLKAEIAAEGAADGKTAPVVEDETAGDEEVEAKAEGEETPDDEPKPEDEKKPEVRAEEEKPKPKKKAKEPAEKMIPVERLNEEAVKRRKAEKIAEELTAEVEKLKNPKKAEEQPKPRQLTLEEVRVQERAAARLEIQLEDFVASGPGVAGTQEAFDAACNKINDLISGPSNLIAIAIEATGSPKDAAKALYQLGQDDVSEIEKFLALSPIRQAARLAKLATARVQRDDEPEPKPKRKAKVEEDEDPPTPLRPIKGNNRVQEGLGDEVPDEVFTERFNQLMDKRVRH